MSAFRVFRARLREAFAAYRSPSVNIDVLLTWGTTRFGSVLVRQDERAVGDSGYTLRKLINHAINMMTGFSVLPLQVASVLGLAFGSMGFWCSVRAPALSCRRKRGARIPLPGLDHRDLLGRPAVRAGDLRGVPGEDAFPLDGASALCAAILHRRAGRHGDCP